jgi:hypothetical protein
VKKSGPKVVETAGLVAAATPAIEINTTGRLAPQLAPLVAVSVRRVAALEKEVAELSLGDVLNEGDAPDRRKRLVQELHEARAERDRLVSAHATALDRDERSENEVRIARLEAEFLEFEKAAAARLEAAQEFDRAAKLLSEAWRRLRASSELVVAIVPGGTHLPRGYQPTNLRALAKHAVYRHSAIGGPGDEVNALPFGEPPSMMTRFNPEAIPAAAETIGDECRWIVGTIRGQIQLTAKFKRGEREVAA